MTKSNCDDCFYSKKLYHGGLRYCSYVFQTNKMRPCPPGDECTVKVSREVKRRKKKVNKNEYV